MKRNKERTKLLDSISIFTNKLQNCSTKKKSKNKPFEDINNNNKISFSIFNTIISSKKSKNREQTKIKRSSSSFIGSKTSGGIISNIYKCNKKKPDANLNKRNSYMSLIKIPNNINIKTSIIDNKNKSLNRDVKNLFYSPASPYTPPISTVNMTTSRYSYSNSNDNIITRRIPSSFNAFEIPPMDKKVTKPKKSKYINSQSILKEKIKSLLENIFKETVKLSKKLAAIDYNKGIKLSEANEIYIKDIKELYEEREKKVIYLFEKYRYGLEYIKYKDKKKYIEIFNIRALELTHVDKDFKIQKEKIRYKYQNSYDLIKEEEENEIKKLLENKIIEKSRNKLLNILGNNN